MSSGPLSVAYPNGNSGAYRCAGHVEILTSTSSSYAKYTCSEDTLTDADAQAILNTGDHHRDPVHYIGDLRRTGVLANLGRVLLCAFLLDDATTDSVSVILRSLSSSFLTVGLSLIIRGIYEADGVRAPHTLY